MGYIFIELYNYTTRWNNCPEPDRSKFIETLIASLQELPRLGVEVIGYGVNDADTDQRAPYDFYCVYKSAGRDGQTGFEKAIRDSGWYDYFEQVNIRGVARAPEEVLRENVRLILPTADH